MELSTKDVQDIAALAKVGMTPEEIEVMRGQLSDILDRFNTLSEVDTDGVETTAHPSGVATTLREDAAEECQSQDDTLANAPNRQGEFVRVKAVLD